jgi:hypothetical protein
LLKAAIIISSALVFGSLHGCATAEEPAAKSDVESTDQAAPAEAAAPAAAEGEVQTDSAGEAKPADMKKDKKKAGATAKVSKKKPAGKKKKK